MRIILMLVMIINFSCRNDFQQVTTETDSSINKDKSTLTRLDNEQITAWEDIRLEVQQNCINPFFKKNKIIDDCTNCSRLTMVYNLSIDKTGFITDLKKVSEEIECNLSKVQREELNQIVINFLKRKKYPLLLRNITFETGIGYLLRC